MLMAHAAFFETETATGGGATGGAAGGVLMADGTCGPGGVPVLTTSPPGAADFCFSLRRFVIGSEVPKVTETRFRASSR